VILFFVFQTCFSTNVNGPGISRFPAFTVWLMAVSMVLGLGISSTLFSLWNMLCGQPNGLYVVLESLFWIGLLLMARWLCPRPLKLEMPSSSGKFHAAGLLGLILLGASLALTLWECSVWHERCPHGINDGVEIWNLRARFLYQSPGDWRAAFSPAIWHADYPLLLPASVARAWFFIGSDWTGVPILIADIFGIGLVIILTSAAWMLRGPFAGVLVGLAILSTSELVLQSMSQIADVPLACMVAITVTGWLTARRWPAAMPCAWLIVGLSLGSALWLKNEGIAFAIMGLLIIFVCERPRFCRAALVQRWAHIAIGLGMFLIATAVFHACFPTHNDLVAGQGSSTVERVCDLSRHLEILSWLCFQLARVGPGLLLVLAVYGTLLGRDRAGQPCSDVFAPLLLLGVQLLVCYVVYLTTPHSLTWHLKTSLDRVLLHLWPSAVLLLLLIVRTPAERLAYDATLAEERQAAEIELR
jgi:hypothetical protein